MNVLVELLAPATMPETDASPTKLGIPAIVEKVQIIPTLILKWECRDNCKINKAISQDHIVLFLIGCEKKEKESTLKPLWGTLPHTDNKHGTQAWKTSLFELASVI